jgi:hypothetical protein
MRLACSSVGEDFGWVRLIEAPPRIIGNDSRELVSFLSELAISTHKIRALGAGQAEKELSGWRPLCNSARTLLTIWSLDYRVASALDVTTWPENKSRAAAVVRDIDQRVAAADLGPSAQVEFRLSSGAR